MVISVQGKFGKLNLISLTKYYQQLKKIKMNKNLLFDFTVDKAIKTVFITREFAAGLSLVWDAFTKPEMLGPMGSP